MLIIPADLEFPYFMHLWGTVLLNMTGPFINAFITE